VAPTDLLGLRSRLLLTQDPDDLLLAEPAALYPLPLPDPTRLKFGEVCVAQVTDSSAVFGTSLPSALYPAASFILMPSHARNEKPC
jgi:hypothetical protein